MAKTKSNRAAARYLNVSYQHYRKYAKLYKNEEGITLLEAHKNQAGKGIPKFLSNRGKFPPILDIIEGRTDPSSFDPQKIKDRLITEGYLEEKCYKCGFNDRRVIDYKMPLIMNFKDGNKKHYRSENIEMLCYNCYFLYHGEVFDQKDLEQFEDYVPKFKTTKKVELDLDPYHLKRLQELGLGDNDEELGDDLISRI